MSIPDFQSLMLPLLQLIADKQEYCMYEIVDTLSWKFNLTDVQKQKLLPSGHQKTFNNRVGWARTYMKKAGLVESPRRSFVRITDRGLNVIEENPKVINTRFLSQYPEFIDFQNSSRSDNDVLLSDDDDDIVFNPPIATEDDEALLTSGVVSDDDDEDILLANYTSDDDDILLSDDDILDSDAGIYRFSAKLSPRGDELLKLVNGKDENQCTLLVEGEDNDLVFTYLFEEEKLVTVWNRSTALEVARAIQQYYAE